MGGINLDFQKIGESFSSVLDTAGGFVDRFFDTQIVINERQAQLAMSESQEKDARFLSDYERGNSASQWADPMYNLGGTPINQKHLLYAGLGIIAFAILKD